MTVAGDVVRMRDLGSSNGTLHNSVRVEEATLAAGDQLSLGPVNFLVRIDGQPPEDAFIPAGDQPVAVSEEVAAVDAIPVVAAEPAHAEAPVVEDEDPLAAMAAAAAALDAEPRESAAAAPAKPVSPAKPAAPARSPSKPAAASHKPQVIEDADLPRKIEPELDSPTVDLDDPISALERLAADQAAMEELAYLTDPKGGKKKSGK